MPVPLVHYRVFDSQYRLVVRLLLITFCCCCRENSAQCNSGKVFGLNFYWCHNCVQSATRNLQLATCNVQLVARLHSLRFALKS